ncbi:TPA: CSS-motif domain-containing protein [Salmonella enterica]
MNYPGLKACWFSLVTGGTALVMLFLWSNYYLESETRSRLRVSGKYIENMIKNTRQASRQAFSFMELPCTTDLRSRLQNMVIETSHMRAIELISFSGIYCSSVISHQSSVISHQSQI